MRPIYENDVSRATEREVVADVELMLNAKCVKLPISYRVDYAITSDGKSVRAWAEIKGRNRKYSTLLLAASKWVTMLNLSRATGMPSFLFVRWPEGICWARVTEAVPVEYEIAGRTDRGDPDDIEPCAMIPVRVFTALEKMRPDIGVHAEWLRQFG